MCPIFIICKLNLNDAKLLQRLNTNLVGLEKPEGRHAYLHGLKEQAGHESYFIKMRNECPAV